MKTQREAVHLDHALSGVELPRDAALPKLADLLSDALRGGSPEKLKQLAIAIQRFNRNSLREFMENNETEYADADAVEADREIFEALWKLGAAPASYETFTRVLRYDNVNPLSGLFRNRIFADWFVRKAHLYGIAVSTLMAALNRESLTGADFERALNDGNARFSMLIFIGMILMPALAGITVRVTSGQVLEIEELLSELESESDRKIIELHKVIRCMVMLHKEGGKEYQDEDARKKISAKILLVKNLVQRALSGEDDENPVVEPEEYGGRLAVGSSAVNRTLEIDFPKAGY